MEGELIVPNKREIERMSEEEGQNMALQIRDKLTDLGMGAEFITGKIGYLLDNCWITNNAGHKSLDAKTYLETLKFITKLHGVKVTESGTVQVAIFNNSGKDKDGNIKF